MKKIVLYFIIASIFSGCMFKEWPDYIKLKPHQKLTAPSFSILTPGSYSQIPFETSEVFNPDNEIFMHRNIPDMMNEDIRLSSFKKFKYKEPLILLDPKINKIAHKKFDNKKLSFHDIENYHEMGVRYAKRYINYVSNIKCMEKVYSNSVANGVGNKVYSLNCPYYDTFGNKIIFYVWSSIVYTYNKTKFENSKISSMKNHTLKDIENQFKIDYKDILDSVVIHDMDINRMKENGLISNKKYDIQAESRAINLAYDCKVHGDDVVCKGMQLNETCTKNILEKKWKCK